jgi:hypothetical protein
MKSVNETVTALQTELRQVRQDDIEFPGIDLDTGAPTRAGEYALADDTYRKLVRRLKEDNFGHTDEELQTAMVHYFTNFQPKLRNSRDAKQWAKDESALNLLKTLPLPQGPEDNRRERFDSAPKAQ